MVCRLGVERNENSLLLVVVGLMLVSRLMLG